jgi:hypothetical protein
MEGTVITKPCSKHPKYQAKRQPKSCPTCWAIYNKVHGIVSRPPAAEPTLEEDLALLVKQAWQNLRHERLDNLQEIDYWRRQWRQLTCRFATLVEEALAGRGLK